MRDRRRDESGAVAILVAMLALALFGIAALVVDLGMARDTRRQAQVAADSAALAAGNTIYATDTPNLVAGVDAAKSYLQHNYGVGATEWVGCTDPARPAGFAPLAGQTACVSFKPLTKPKFIRVVVPTRTVEFGFASILGVDSLDVRAVAESTIKPTRVSPCGLCVIGGGAHDLQQGDVYIDGADIMVNGVLTAGNNGGAIAASGGTISLEGPMPTQGTFSPTPAIHQPPVADPLAFLPLPPSYDGLSVRTGSACSSGPGIYRSLNLAGPTCTLSPGLYVVTGQNHISGQVLVKALGVTFYFTCQSTTTTVPSPRACNAGEAGGDLLLTGQAELDFTAPTSGPYAGLAILADRNNTAELSWRGNGSTASTGTIYLKSGTLNYRGNGAGLPMDSLVVVKDLSFSGNPSQFTAKYTGSKNARPRPEWLHLTY